MSKSPIAASAPVAKKTGRFGLIVLGRVLLLLLGGGGAFGLGIALAHWYPGTIQDPPATEKALRQSRLLWQRLQRWSVPENPSVVVPSPSVAIASPTRTLTPAEKKKVQAELGQLEKDLQQLSVRATALETQIGSNSTATTLESRLRVLALQLNGQPVEPAAVSLAAENRPIFQPDTLQVTLPSDVLFRDAQGALRPETRSLLSSIVPELQRLPGSTVRIAVHTDNVGEIRDNLELSFRQAQAVRAYLSPLLGENYRWVILGYGGSHPLVDNTTNTNRQRNRRTEISVNP